MSGTTKSKIKVLLVDDHPFVRDAVRSSLLRYDHLDVVGEASTGNEALAKASLLLPDVVVMDITMPGMTGLEAARLLRESSPITRVLILTVHETEEFLREVIRSGARGYIRKNTSPLQLLSAIERVYRGEIVFTWDQPQSLLTHISMVTPAYSLPHGQADSGVRVEG